MMAKKTRAGTGLLVYLALYTFSAASAPFSSSTETPVSSTTTLATTTAPPGSPIEETSGTAAGGVVAPCEPSTTHLTITDYVTVTVPAQSSSTGGGESSPSAYTSLASSYTLAAVATTGGESGPGSSSTGPTSVAALSPSTSAPTDSLAPTTTALVSSTDLSSATSSPVLTTAASSTTQSDITSSATLSSATSAASATTGTPPANGTLQVSLYNNLQNGTAYAAFTGQTIDSAGNSQWVMLTPDGNYYYPTSSSDAAQPIPSSANVAIKLNGYGETTNITIPSYIAGARLWLSEGAPLQFGITTAGLVEPSVANPTDPNHNTSFGFVELTFSSEEDGGLVTNLSFVDFIGLALGIEVTGSPNGTQSALGPYQSAKVDVCSKLTNQTTVDGQPWDQLCQMDSNNNVIRVISPGLLISTNSSAFESYFENYVSEIFQQYTTTPLTLDTLSSGRINCTATADASTITCSGDDTPFTRPKAMDIFGCSTGPFSNNGSTIHLAAVPCMCAAFNRATLHLPGGNVQPQLPPSAYYNAPATNFYARFVHETEVDGRGYAFAYDDVSPDQARWNSAGLITVPAPDGMKVYVGGYPGSSTGTRR